MELYQLRYFLEVAREKNITRAARRLHLAQAALSEQIRKLEDDLGTALLVRGRRESRLTPAGEALARRAEALLSAAEATRREIADVAELRAGRLVMASIPSVSACLLPAAVAAFRKQHPGIELAFFEDTTEGVAERVESGEAELGFVQLPVAGRGFVQHHLLAEPFVLLLPSQHRFAARRKVRLQDLSADAFVFYKGRARESASEACRLAGFEPRVACASGDLETIRALVAAGLGAAIIPALAARSVPAGVAVVQIASPRTERTLALLTRKGHAISRAAFAFRTCLGKIAEKTTRRPTSAGTASRRPGA
jgi:DNA-binding transcriptional LysR family regulator